MFPARALPIESIMKQLLNVGLIGKTFPGRQVLRQCYIRHRKTDGDRPHERPVHRGADPTGLIRLVGNIAEIDVGVMDRIQCRELFLLVFSRLRLLHKAPFRGGRFSRGDNSNDGFLFGCTRLSIQADRVCHQDDPPKDRADQLVSLFAIYIAILSREGERIVESQPGKMEIDPVFGAIGSILIFIPLKQREYIQISIYSSGSEFGSGPLCRRWRYSRVHQSGSHIIIETEAPSRQRIAVPNRNPLRIGTFNSILRAVSNHKGVTRDEIVATLG